MSQKMEEFMLDKRQQAILPVAAFTANGDVAKLDDALQAALKAGLTVNQIREILVQLYAYAGFPRSLTALEAFRTLLVKDHDNGLDWPEGVAPTPVPADADRRAIGTEIQTRLVGAPVTGPLFDFAPAIDAFLKEHLFCDIFYRGVLTGQERELATVAALAALPAPGQLRAHLQIALNTGLSVEQLREAAGVLAARVFPEAGGLVARLLGEIAPAGA